MTNLEKFAVELVEAWDEWVKAEGPNGQGDPDGELLSTYIDLMAGPQPESEEDYGPVGDLIRLVYILNDALQYSLQGGGHQIVLDALHAAMEQLARELVERKQQVTASEAPALKR